MDRRTFIEFMGKGTLAIPTLPAILSACQSGTKSEAKRLSESLFPSRKDEVVLMDGLSFDFLIKEGDIINDDMTFGTDNDYIAYFPQSETEGVLWVNHEDVIPMFHSGYTKEKARHRNMIIQEMFKVGGSILKIRKEEGKWKVIVNDPANYRVTGASKIPFEWPELIENYRSAVGTVANCAGGKTPWGTVLTCEENYHYFYGEYDFKTEQRSAGKHEWQSFYPDHHPHHYGWVVEVNLETGSAKKHIGLGRMYHECATVKELSDGRVVIYTGDDVNDGCLYKYISDEPGQIYPGKLYTANLELGRWEWMDISRAEVKSQFKDQTELLIRAKEASLMVGGTKMDRPEDIEIDPITGNVLVSLTNNKPKGNYHGSILSITEKGDYDSLEFTHDTFLTGGEETVFSCPDNMEFDKAGNLWFTSDMSGDAIGKEPYEQFGNNGLFVLIRNGESAGEIIQVASAPNDAEFTGPCIMPDGETLMLSVQHPGGESKDLANLTSHWPGGGTTMPRSAVIAIQGDFIKALQTVV